MLERVYFENNTVATTRTNTSSARGSSSSRSSTEKGYASSCTTAAVTFKSTTPPELSLTPWRSILPFYLPKKATTGEGVFGFSERMAQQQVLLIGLETQVYEGGLVRREPGCAHLKPEPRGTRRHLGDELPFFSRTGA